MVVTVTAVVVVMVVVQGQQSEKVVEVAKGVSNSVGVVEAAAKEGVVVVVENEAEAEVEARRTGVVLGVGVGVVAPTSVEVVEVASLLATSARSMQTQSSRAHEAACHPGPSPGSISWASTVPKTPESSQTPVEAARRTKTDCELNVDPMRSQKKKTYIGRGPSQFDLLALLR